MEFSPEAFSPECSVQKNTKIESSLFQRNLIDDEGFIIPFYFNTTMSSDVVSRDSTDVVGDRIVAQIFDTIFISIQFVLVVASLSYLADRYLIYLSILTLPLYGGLLEGYWNGQTIGKRMTGIKVVDNFNNEPGVRKALIRNLPALVLFSWVAVVVGLAAIATSDCRQRLFDRIAGTYVVATQDSGIVDF